MTTDALALPRLAPEFERAALAFPEAITRSLTSASSQKLLAMRRTTDAAVAYAKDLRDELHDETGVINSLIYGKLLLVARLGAMLPDGRGRPKKGEKKGLADRLFSSAKQTKTDYRRVAKWQQKLEKYRDAVSEYNDDAEYPAEMGIAHFLAFADTDHVLATKHNNDMSEWYTPKEYVDRVRQVLGDIDLDPASCAFAQKTVKAKCYYDKKQDGREQPWTGRVFLNPPYKTPLVSQFVNRLVDMVGSGDVTAAVLLTNNNTDTDWWQRAAGDAEAVCLTDGRIGFNDEHGETSAPTNGQSFCYYGKTADRFLKVFADVGLCLKVVT